MYSQSSVKNRVTEQKEKPQVIPNLKRALDDIFAP